MTSAEQLQGPSGMPVVRVPHDRRVRRRRPFHGFAENTRVVTVGGALRRSIERVLGHTVTLGIAGRTDTGVHAWGQVVTSMPIRRASILEYCNARSTRCAGLLSPCARLAVVEPAFHARFSATSRVYRYCVYNRTGPEPVRPATSLAYSRNRSTWPRYATRVSRLVGTHDFASFCKTDQRRCEPPPPRRRSMRAVRPCVRRSRPIPSACRGPLGPGEGMLVFEIEARVVRGRQMVRSIVGTLVDVGSGAGAGRAMCPPIARRAIATSRVVSHRPMAWCCGWVRVLMEPSPFPASPVLALFAVRTDPAASLVKSVFAAARVGAVETSFERRGALSVPTHSVKVSEIERAWHVCRRRWHGARPSRHRGRPHPAG
jgi:tRNA pseudouridine38-40 synthase